MNRELIDTFLIARHDVMDAMRSRRMIVWILLYLCVAVAGTFVFSRIVDSIENQIASTVMIDASDNTGQVTTVIQKSKTFEKIVNQLIDDKDIARQLLTLHPLVIFYAWFSFTFMPILVIILCSDTIAKDVQNRNVRFSLFRTTRTAYAIGKGISASAILLLALTVSAIATCVTGLVRFQSVNPLDIIPPMLLFLVKCWVFNLAFLGVALMASLIRRSPFKAQFLALLTYFFLIILYPIAHAKSGDGLARLWQIGVIISPSSYILGLWHPLWNENIRAATFCIGLGFLFFFIGFFSFSRKDL